MSIQKLVTSFTTSCWIPSCKTLIAFMKTLDKKISNFQLYFNSKKYNSTNKVSFSDKERYDVFVEQLVEQIKTDETIKLFTSNYENWIKELILCLKSEYVYNSLNSNFLKGSYGKMIDDFNRILLPKSASDDDNEETDDPTENLKKQVKNYSLDFEILIKECVENGFKLYKSVHINQEDDDTPIKDEMLNIQNPVFSIYAFTQLKIVGLWISETSLEYEEIPVEEFINYITTMSFNLNPEHLTNMDTIKRNYINKQFDLFKSHVKLLTNANSLFFYTAEYLHSADYNSYSELQFLNAVNSFPTSFEDYTRNAFVLFYFNKSETVSVNTFWVTSKPIELTLSEYDKGLFSWTNSTCEEFLSSDELYKDASLSILH